MKKTILSLTLLVGLGFHCNAQIVNIPDANFKAYLVGTAFINTNLDTEIQVSEAAAYSTQLNCAGLNISDLTGIEAFSSMTGLQCENNLLTFLDVSACSSLLYLYCQNNLLTSLVFSPAVRELSCSNNQLTSIDLSANTNLYILFCTNNQLTSLNVANGNNEIMWTSGFNTTNNPSLTCLEVDDAYYSLVNWWYIDSWTTFSNDCNGSFGCTVTIPDANFKAYLVGNSAINTNLDTEIQCSEATSFNGTIDCFNLTIADLTGIEAFSSLTSLVCSDNQLTNLNVNSLPALSSLNCSNNQLTTLDLSSNVSLTSLNCQGNYLTSLNVSSNTNLTYLNCQFNEITSLNLSSNTVLATLNCMFNELTSLTFANSITVFQCTNNQLTSLDLSGNTALTVLTCGDNQLTALNVKNGNNLNMNSVLFYTQGNPGLACIEVDDASYSTSNWTYIDPTSSFSIDCDGGLGLQTNEITEMTLYPNPATTLLTIDTEELIRSISIFNVSGKRVQYETVPTFSVQELPQGVYLVNIVTENGVQTLRFIKE